jgi:hypothetical protein
MNLISNSKDILNISIAISVIGFTVFLCLATFYMAMILKQAYVIFKEMRDRLHKIDELIKSVKDKVDSSISYLLLISEGVKKLVEVIKNVGSKNKKDVEEEE